MVSIPACHAGDRGSIPRRGVFFSTLNFCSSQTRLVRCGQSNGIRHESKKGFQIGTWSVDQSEDSIWKPIKEKVWNEIWITKLMKERLKDFMIHHYYVIIFVHYVIMSNNVAWRNIKPVKVTTTDDDGKATGKSFREQMKEKCIEYMDQGTE